MTLNKKDSSYNQIVKATSIYSGSQAINIALGLIRTKVIAILLGPAGVGLIGVYQSMIEMIRSLGTLGMEPGTIREIAKAANEEDKHLLGKSIFVFDRWFVFAACIGMFICILFSYPLSYWIFDDKEHALPIALLSIAVFFAIITIGRSVILQGMRKISYLAKATIGESMLGLLIIIPIYYFFGIAGVIPALIINSLIVYFCIHYYYKKLEVRSVSVPFSEVVNTGKRILKLGLFVLVAGVVNAASMFIVRTYLAHELDLSTVGLFQSAWTITSVYVALILGSTRTDYFSRLCSIIDNKAETKKLVNEQSYIVLVIAAPVVIGLLLFSHLALFLLYSSRFTGAGEILQWMVIGTYLKILATPIATILLAKSKGRLYLFSEVLFFATYLLSCYLLFPQMGVAATGFGYLIAYVVYLFAIFIICNNISGFAWSIDVLKMIAVNALFITIALCITHIQSEYILIFGCVLFFLSLIYAFLKLKRVFSLNELKDWFRKK
ncbi:O-antigen translocase [Dysgonomonas sp. ZJ279]|uniref:O-antigen translocase n=1 Tax=Dysgonomonas sp. ZJ279 TaxID=2709796 RepID=UPI00210785B2|nr:O-antigen translocase [Dysgonomonas sp. ZJ279]